MLGIAVLGATRVRERDPIGTADAASSYVECLRPLDQAFPV